MDERITIIKTTKITRKQPTDSLTKLSDVTTTNTKEIVLNIDKKNGAIYGSGIAFSLADSRILKSGNSVIEKHSSAVHIAFVEFKIKKS